MLVDLLGSIELTAGAGIVTLILANGLGATRRTRTLLIVVFASWFGLVTVLAATEVLHRSGPAGLAGLGAAVVLPVLAMTGLAFASDEVLRSLKRIPVSWLIAANTVRIIGVFFLLLHAQNRLPAPFAPVAGWGDILVGATAPYVAWLVATRGADVQRTVLSWNIIGLADLIMAIGLGIVSSPGPLNLIVATPGSGIMTTLPWLLIPAFLVPMLMGTHLAIFYKLRTGIEPDAVRLAYGSSPRATTT
jgi:hypothetical protein